MSNDTCSKLTSSVKIFKGCGHPETSITVIAQGADQAGHVGCMAIAPATCATSPCGTFGPGSLQNDLFFVIFFLSFFDPFRGRSKAFRGAMGWGRGRGRAPKAQHYFAPPIPEPQEHEESREQVLKTLGPFRSGCRGSKHIIFFINYYYINDYVIVKLLLLLQYV